MRDTERDFAWKNMSKGTRQRWCKFCQAEANKKHYQNNKQAYIEHAYQYHQNNREKYIDIARKRAKSRHTENRQKLHEYLCIHPCVDCGQSDIQVLEFDHVRGIKLGNVAYMTNSNSSSWAEIQAEIEKCKVRCANCHRIRTLDDRSSWRSNFNQ